MTEITMKCIGYQTEEPCGWSGTIDECEVLGGGLICPKCGGNVQRANEIPVMRPITRAVRLPREEFQHLNGGENV